MKKIITAMLCLGTIFTACKKEDKATPAAIEGTWTYVNSTYKETDSNGHTSTESHTYSDTDHLQLNSNGTFTYTLEGDDGSGTWKLANNGKTLIVTEGTNVDSITVNSLTANAMSLYTKYTYSSSVDETTINFKR